MIKIGCRARCKSESLAAVVFYAVYQFSLFIAILNPCS